MSCIHMARHGLEQVRADSKCRNALCWKRTYSQCSARCHGLDLLLLVLLLLSQPATTNSGLAVGERYLSRAAREKEKSWTRLRSLRVSDTNSPPIRLRKSEQPFGSAEHPQHAPQGWPIWVNKARRSGEGGLEHFHTHFLMSTQSGMYCIRRCKLSRVYKPVPSHVACRLLEPSRITYM